MTTSFASGSSKFGDSQNDVHQFTGSLQHSGSFNFSLGVGDKRVFKDNDSAGVVLQRTDGTGGWAMEYGFNTNNGTNIGGFGAFGGNSALEYF